MNTKHTIFAFTCLFASISLLFSGCGSDKIPQGKFTQEQMRTIPMTNRYSLPEATGGMIFSVDSETVSANEVIGPLEQNLTQLAQRTSEDEFVSQTLPVVRQVVRDRAADLLLYKEARKNAPETIDELLDKAVEKEVKRFIANYNNDYAEAEKQLKSAGMDWRSYRDFQRKMILTQSYLSSNLFEAKRFSHTELLEFYNEVKEERFHRPGMLQFRLIDLQEGKLTAEQMVEGESPREALRRRAKEVMAKLESGREFESLVGEYSQGPMAPVGGLWRPVTIGAESLPKPYDVIETTAKDASKGQIVGPIEAQDHIFIVRVEDVQKEEMKQFEEVQQILETQLQMRHQRQQQEDMLNGLIQRADLLELERFSEFCAREAYRRWGRK